MTTPMSPIRETKLQSSPIYRTYAAGAKDLLNEGPNGGATDKIPAKGVQYKGAMTVRDPAGTSVTLIPVSDYVILPIQFVEVVSSANDYTVFW